MARLGLHIVGTSRRYTKCLIALTFGAVILAATDLPAIGGDLGGDCCADIEERVAELEAATVRHPNRKIELTIEGVVNRAALIWDDGERRDTYIVDNAQDGSNILIEGEGELGDGWKAGLTFGIDFLLPSSDFVDQLNDGTPNELLDIIDLSDSFVTVSNERFGTINFGLTDTAADGIANILLSKSYVVADGDTSNWIGNFFLQAQGISGRAGLAIGEADEGFGVAEIRWGDFLIDSLGGDTLNAVTYISPAVRDFEFSASWGENDFWDVALRYNADWGKILRVEAGIGYVNNTTEDTLFRFPPRDLANQLSEDPLEPVDDVSWGGGLAVRHLQTGLNIAFNYGTQRHTDECLERGLVSNRCRGRDEFYYINGGIVRNFTGRGDTAFYGEYQQVRRNFNESDEDVLQALELEEGQAEELKDSLATVWGFGVVQQLQGIDTETSGSVLEAYVGYRHYSLDLDLIDTDGPVANRQVKDFDAILAGVNIFF